MSAYSRLTRFTCDKAQAARDARRLGKGILKSGSPHTSQATSAGDQPPNARLHFRNAIPLILQFPPEILYKIVAYVEPIWLFQLEEAHPILAEFLSTQGANKIWYELLPAALMSEPKYFQDEGEVQKILQALRGTGAEDKITFQRQSKYKLGYLSYSGFGSSGIKCWYSNVISGIKFHLTSVSRTWSVTKSTVDDTIILPRIDHLSELSRNLHMHFYHRHPRDDNQYPLITSESKPTRARVLALGGSYDQSMSYRREFAGHVHTTKRCYLCLEVFISTQDGGFRSETRAWGMRWCKDCMEQWTIQSEDIDKVSGLRPLLKKSAADPEFGSLWMNTFTNSTQSSWKPYVDAVLRKSIGIDFDTAFAKEEYMRQVSKALTSTKRPITSLRQALRREIVQIAQDLSTSPDYDNVSANLAKQTFARPTELSIFLLRAGLLYEENMFDPYDPDEAWLSDPTESFTLSRDIRRKLGDTGRKKQKAKAMLSMLFHPHSPGGGVTAFEQATRSRHIQRISRNMSADTTIEVLNKKFPPQESPFIRTPNCSAAGGQHTIICHLDVLLAKLYIHRGAFDCLPRLSPHELKLGKEVYFKKLALQTCITCPRSGMLILVRGVEGVVQHHQEAHPEKFWSSDDCTISG